MLRVIDALASGWLTWRTARRAKQICEEQGLELRKAEVDEQGFYFDVISPVVAELANEAATMLDHANAKNYVQFDMMPRIDKGIRPIRVTVAWANGEMPAAKADRLEKELAACKEAK